MTREQFISQVKATEKHLRRFLLALCCGDTPLADDIAQETYIKAYLCSDTVSDIAKFKSWIFRIAHNVFIDHCRSSRQSADYAEIQSMASGDSSDDSFRYQALYLALDALPPKERTSVLLFYMEGYSVKEIAEIVQASQDNVRQHLSRGRAHLRTSLSNN